MCSKVADTGSASRCGGQLRSIRWLIGSRWAAPASHRPGAQSTKPASAP